jgi:hypothetical protein
MEIIETKNVRLRRLDLNQRLFGREPKDASSISPNVKTTVYITVAGARRFQGIRPQSVYIKDQPSWQISVSNCIYETYDLGETLLLGGGFRTFAGPPTVSNGRTTVSKTVALCTTRLSIP